MLDKTSLYYFEKTFNPFARLLVKKTKITPNDISFVGFILGLLSALFIYFEMYNLSILLICLNRFCDGLDGLVARHSKKNTNSGAFLDIMFDFIFYFSIPFAFGLQNIEKNGFITLFILFSIFMTMTSFLATSIMAEKSKIKSNTYKKKSFYYSKGFIESSETIIFYILILIFPFLYNYIGVVFSILCFYTAINRIINSYQEIKQALN